MKSNQHPFYLLAFVLVFPFITNLSSGEEMQYFTRQEVLDSLKEMDPIWKSKIAETSPHMFYNAKQWPSVIERVKALKDASAKRRDDFFEEADKLAAEPLPVYRSPEEFVKLGMGTPFTAGGEGWMRGVGSKLVALAIAAKLTGDVKYQTAIHDMSIRLCEFPSWGNPDDPIFRNADLAGAHSLTGLAVVYDLYPELFTQRDRELIFKVVRERGNCMLRGQYGYEGKIWWGKAYQDNHNHVNSCGLGLAGLAFYKDIPEAPEWLAASRLNFLNVAKYYPEDACSSEGIPYWTYSIHYVLQYIEGTRLVTDSGDIYKTPFLKNAIACRLNASTGGFKGIMPWGDAPSHDYYGPHQFLTRLADQYHDPVGQWLIKELPFAPLADADVRGLTVLWDVPMNGSSISGPNYCDYHYWVNDCVNSRSGWGLGDYTLAIKSGFTNRNHSHLDAGSIALSFGTEWLLSTPGYGQGAGDREYWDGGGLRWQYYANATEAESTLLINGQNQRFENEARSTVDQFISTPSWCWTGIDLTEAYNNVTSARRDVLHRRSEYILVFDSVIMPKESTVEWLVQPNNDPVVHGSALQIGDDGDNQLRVSMLIPDSPFVARKPTSPKIDVDKSKIHTYAVKQTGVDVSYISFIQPKFAGQSFAELETQVETKESNCHKVVIYGKGWTDTILHGTKRGELMFGNGQKNQIHATAKTMIIRTDDRGIESSVLVDVTTFSGLELQLKLEKPAQFATQRLPDDSLLIDGNNDLKGRLSVLNGLTITPIPQSDTGSDEKHFRYIVTRTGMTPEKASQFIIGKVVNRPAFTATPIRIRPLPKLEPLPASVTASVEAEDFVKQKFGEVEIVVRPAASGGKCIVNFGNSTPQQRITWQLNIPKSGRYTLKIRYCTKEANVKAALLIDGATPDKSLAELSFPSTGSWSSEQNAWKDLNVSDSSGKTFVFNLTEGKHLLELINPSGQLNLDKFDLTGNE